MPSSIYKYTIAICLAILLLLVLHLNFGTNVTAVPVAILFYGWLIFITVRWLIQVILKRKKHESR